MSEMRNMAAFVLGFDRYSTGTSWVQPQDKSRKHLHNLNAGHYTSGFHWRFALSHSQAFLFRKSTASHPVRQTSDGRPSFTQYNRYHPGKRALFSPASILGATLPKIRWVSYGRNTSFTEKHQRECLYSPFQPYIAQSILYVQLLNRPVGTSFHR